MEFYDLFYKWVPLYIRIPVLTLLYLVLLTANGVYTGNYGDMSSGLGGYSEPYTMAYYAMYIGMGIGSMSNIRIRERFTAKTLLLFGLVAMLLMNLVCATTNNPYLTILACFLLGVGKVSASTEVYLVWLQIWSKKLDVSRLYPFVYFIALSGLYSMTWLTTKLAYFYDWRYAYIAIFILILACIILTVIFVEHHTLRKKVPLYQMDWPGITLLVTFMMLINYILTYGKVEDWNESTRIKSAEVAAVIVLLLFVRRELSFKRPVFPMDLFRLPNFRLGLFYFLLLGIFTPATIQASFSGATLHYENFRSAELTLYLIPGIIGGCVFCYYWFYQKYHDHLLMLIGFVISVCYEAMMYNSFGNSFEMHQFWLPSLIKGLGICILFIAIGIYITRGHTIKDVLTVVGIAYLIRSFLGTALFSSVYNYLLYAQRIRHLNYLGGLMDSGNDSGNVSDAFSSVQTQAAIATEKELTGYIILIGLVIIVILVVSVVADVVKAHAEKTIKVNI
ncbi:MAG: hypothetical protein M3O71_09650 [Bacteroidota bacterium]|nr:hypothetical protein [Bacteroidota bacterium]